MNSLYDKWMSETVKVTAEPFAGRQGLVCTIIDGQRVEVALSQGDDKRSERLCFFIRDLEIVSPSTGKAT